MLVTGALVRFSSKINIFASNDKRRLQKNLTPLLGGLGINAGLLLFVILAAWDRLPLGFSLPIFALALLTISALGAADDKIELGPTAKFLGQNLISVLLIVAVWGVETPIHRFLSPSPWVVIPIQWFWVMGLLNSMNLIDGLDGLAAGIGVIALSFLSFLSFQQTGSFPPLGVASIAAVLGFLIWNRHPAKIYMGESGSMAIGALLFVASMSLHSRSASFITIVAPILAVGIPALDTLVAIIRRSRRRSSIGSGDRDHIHHRLLRLGVSHSSVVHILYAISIYLCMLSYQLFPESEFSIYNTALSAIGMLTIAGLVVLIERKLYTYLRNFGDQMLQVMDAQTYGSLTTFMRMVNLTEQSIPFRAFRINLENCIQTLLIASPGRILTFYTDLADHLRQDSLEREVYFESSTKLLLLYRLEPGGTEKVLRQDVIELLREFEKDKSIDLYLGVPNTLLEIDQENELGGERREEKRKGIFGRRAADRALRGQRR